MTSGSDQLHSGLQMAVRPVAQLLKTGFKQNTRWIFKTFKVNWDPYTYMCIGGWRGWLIIIFQAWFSWNALHEILKNLFYGRITSNCIKQKEWLETFFSQLHHCYSLWTLNILWTINVTYFISYIFLDEQSQELRMRE